MHKACAGANPPNLNVTYTETIGLSHHDADLSIVENHISYRRSIQDHAQLGTSSTTFVVGDPEYLIRSFVLHLLKIIE